MKKIEKSIELVKGRLKKRGNFLIHRFFWLVPLATEQKISVEH
jgi:hypothetical protein